MAYPSEGPVAHVVVQAPGSKIGGRVLDVYTLTFESAESAAAHFRASGYRAVIKPGNIVHVWDTAKGRALDRAGKVITHAHGKMSAHRHTGGLKANPGGVGGRPVDWFRAGGRSRQRMHRHPAHNYSHPASRKHRRK